MTHLKSNDYQIHQTLMWSMTLCVDIMFTWKVTLLKLKKSSSSNVVVVVITSRISRNNCNCIWNWQNIIVIVINYI